MIEHKKQLLTGFCVLVFVLFTLQKHGRGDLAPTDYRSLVLGRDSTQMHTWYSALVSNRTIDIKLSSTSSYTPVAPLGLNSFAFGFSIHLSPRWG